MPDNRTMLEKLQAWWASEFYKSGNKALERLAKEAKDKDK